VTGGRNRFFRALVLLELAEACRFYLRGMRDRNKPGLPAAQSDAASLNIAVAIQNLEEAASRLTGRYRIRRSKSKPLQLAS
jgi:hypothetical protein